MYAIYIVFMIAIPVRIMREYRIRNLCWCAYWYAHQPQEFVDPWESQIRNDALHQDAIWYVQCWIVADVVKREQFHEWLFQEQLGTRERFVKLFALIIVNIIRCWQ